MAWESAKALVCFAEPFAEVKERNHPDEEMLSVTITRGVIRQKALLADSSKKDSSNLNKSAYKLVCPGDIAYNKMRAWQGAIGVSGYRGIVSPAYVIMRLRDDYNPRYFHELYRTPQFAKEAERWSYGITSDMWSLRPEHFKMIYSAVPPLDEQDTIVRFLDHANRQIERYIRAKKKLIALLNEQKQAIIDRAVTRGLDPDVRLKPSGIPWLGDIPEHYSRTRLGRVCLSIRDGTHNPPPAAPGNHRLLSVRNIIDGRFVTRADDRTMTPEAFAELQRSYTVIKGDVVIAIVGATTGKSAVVEQMDNVTVQRSLGILRPNADVVDSHFLNLLIASETIQSQIRMIMGKYAAQPGTYLTELGRLHVVYPPVETQRQIVAWVGEQTKELDVSVYTIRREINLINEYRTRLVTDVVTGRLDVRAAAAKLPEEPEELEPFDDAETLVESEEALNVPDFEEDTLEEHV